MRLNYRINTHYQKFSNLRNGCQAIGASGNKKTWLLDKTLARP